MSRKSNIKPNTNILQAILSAGMLATLVYKNMSADQQRKVLERGRKAWSRLSGIFNSVTDAGSDFLRPEDTIIEGDVVDTYKDEADKQ